MMKHNTYITIAKALFGAVVACVLLCSITSPARAQADITTGLVGHWKLDETSGTGIIDYASSNDGTVQGGLDPSTNSVTGRLNKALDFDGANDYIDINDSASLSFNGKSLSVCAWANMNDMTTAAFVSKCEDNSNPNCEFSFGTHGGDQLRFDMADAVITSRIGLISSNPITNDEGSWHHYCGTYDGGATNASIQLYRDGTVLSTSSNNNGVFSAVEDTGSAITIGAHLSLTGFSEWADGSLDDVRIYDRALTAEDIAELYRSWDGNIDYNTDARVPEYFNGEQWTAMGPKTYIPNAVEFDGATRLTNTSLLTGVTDGNTYTGSVWFRNPGASASEVLFYTETGRLELYLSAAGSIVISARNPAASYILSLQSTISGLDDGAWHHLMWSVDMSDTGKRHLYVDGVSQLTVNTYIDDTIDFTDSSGYTLGSTVVGSQTFPLSGDVSDFWMDFNNYIDLSIEANRRKFIDANGDPVYLGASGSIPTGSAPDIFLSGDTLDWHTNKGTGGGFTENGALTTAPSPATANESWQQIGNNLNISGVSRPSLATLNSSTIAFIDGNNEDLSTYSWSGTDWVQIGNSLNILGASNLYITALDNKTIALCDDSYENLNTYSWDGTDWSQVGNSLNITGINDPAISALDATTVAFVEETFDEIRTYSWDGTDWSQVGNGLNISNVANSSIAKLDSSTIAYVDDVGDELRTYSWDGTDWSQVGNSLSLPSIIDPALTALSSTAVAFIDDTNADLRIYVWNGTDWSQVGNDLNLTSINNSSLTALNESTIAFIESDNDNLQTYGRNYCSNPVRAAGSLIYNTDDQVMQYCDGEDWRAMGPYPGAGTGGCANPTRAEGSLIYSKDYSVMQYCDGDEWVNVGQEPLPCPVGSAVGTVCDDGSVYAGLSPDGDVRMYTTQADEVGTYTWNNGNGAGTWTDVSSPDCTDNGPGAVISTCITGAANTAVLVASDSDSLTSGMQPHQAAQQCHDLVAHGQSDWYLPAMEELWILYNNQIAIGGFVTNQYWSSSENDVFNVRRINFGSGVPNATNKDQTLYVRCVRKD